MSSSLTLPKVELHVHLEGTITPSMVKKLAKRNNLPLPQDIFGPEETFLWKDFEDFLKAYDKASSCLRTPEDYYDITYDYLARIAKQGAIYTELMDSPDHAALCGLSYQDHLQGVEKAIQQAESDFGITARIIITGVRHFGLPKCIKVAELAAHHPSPWVVGFGMGGNAKDLPTQALTEVYQIAHQAGLYCTVHAGEIEGADSVWQALEYLPIQRIGHGVRSVEDPRLFSELINRNITLEVCPGSNISLRVFPNYASHPFVQLYKAGISLSLGSDDPPYFNTSIGQEYEGLKKNFGLGDEDLIKISKNAILNSFADKATKERLMKRIENKT